jgi:hypothetical protein
MSCDSLNEGRAASLSLITDNLMASGSPSRSEIAQYVTGTPINMLRTPLWHTASPFPTSTTAWQQISSTPKTHYAAHTPGPSNFTPFNSSTSGIFQYNSAPNYAPPPNKRTQKRLNNENPDTPAPKRARKTASGTVPRPNPLSAITASAINENFSDNLNESLGNNSESVPLTDTEHHKLTRFFTFLQEDLEWSYGELLYYTTIGKSPGAIRDKTGKSTNTKVVQRNAAIHEGQWQIWTFTNPRELAQTSIRSS